MGEQQRLFLALWPDLGVREALAAIQQRMECRRGRLVHPLDLHVTVVFLGMVDAERLACVEGVAGRAQAAAFDLPIDQTGYWRRSRVAWCGPQFVPAALAGLVEKLQHGLRDCGFRPEQRAYRPHVTLARDARAAVSGPVENPVIWRCERFVLVASTGAPQPPRYRVLREWPLGTATGSGAGS